MAGTRLTQSEIFQRAVGSCPFCGTEQAFSDHGPIPAAQRRSLHQVRPGAFSRDALTAAGSQIQPTQLISSIIPIARQVSHTTPIGVSQPWPWAVGTQVVPLQHLYRGKPVAEPRENQGAWIVAAAPPGDMDEIPDQAGGPPTVTVAHANHKAVGSPGERYDRVAPSAGDLGRLRRGVHDLEPSAPP